MGKARTFLEVFASALNEDFRFPALEIIVSIHTVGIFIILWVSTGSGPGAQPGLVFQILQRGSPEAVKAIIVSSLAGLWSFVFTSPIFGMLILKNIAYSLGNDLERGVIQNVLSYPLKRRYILTAKLLSSVGVVYMLMLGIQIFELFILVPDTVSQNIGFVLLTFMAALSCPLLVTGLVLLLTLLFKRGSIALFTGIGLYFSISVVMLLLITMAGVTSSDIPLKIAAILFPGIALGSHYQYGLDPSISKLWTPSFDESLFYIGAGYALAFFVLAMGYLYFERRLEI